jgi:hypothetical protein
VPWCDDCARFWSPNSVAEDGTCPTCGRSLDAPRPAHGPIGTAADDPTAGMGPDEIDTRVPWHFWVMVAALCIYLGWRLVQGVAWLLG